MRSYFESFIKCTSLRCVDALIDAKGDFSDSKKIVVTSIEFSPEQSAMDWSKDVKMRYTVRSSVLEDPDTKFYVYRIFIKDYNDNSPKQGSYEECELKYILIEHDGNLHVVSVEGVISGEDGYIPSICTREPVTVLPTPDTNQSSVTQYKPTDECEKFIIQQFDYLNEHDLLSYYAGFAPGNAKTVS